MVKIGPQVKVGDRHAEGTHWVRFRNRLQYQRLSISSRDRAVTDIDFARRRGNPEGKGYFFPVTLVRQTAGRFTHRQRKSLSVRFNAMKFLIRSIRPWIVPTQATLAWWHRMGRRLTVRGRARRAPASGTVGSTRIHTISKHKPMAGHNNRGSGVRERTHWPARVNRAADTVLKKLYDEGPARPTGAADTGFAFVVDLDGL